MDNAEQMVDIAVCQHGLHEGQRVHLQAAQPRLCTRIRVVRRSKDIGTKCRDLARVGTTSRVRF